MESLLLALLCCFICCCAHMPDNVDHDTYVRRTPIPKYASNDKVILVVSSPRFDNSNSKRSTEIKNTLKSTGNVTYESIVSLGSQTRTGQQLDWDELNNVFGISCPNKTVYVSLGYGDFLDNLGRCSDWWAGDTTQNGCAVSSLRNIGTRLNSYRNISLGFWEDWIQKNVFGSSVGKEGLGSMSYGFDVANSNYTIHVMHVPWNYDYIIGAHDKYSIEAIYNNFEVRSDRRNIVFIHDTNCTRYSGVNGNNHEVISEQYHDLFKRKKIELVISSSDIDVDSSNRAPNNVVVKDDVVYVKIGADVTVAYSWLILPHDKNSRAIIF